MTDNSTNFDNLQERNQQVLNNISKLQIQEKDLYQQLEDVSLSAEQKQDIINKINEISQIRLNLYEGLKDMFLYYQENIAAAKTTLGQSAIAVDVLENELNQSKKRINLIEDRKNDKLRLVEINTYFGKRYNAHANLMKTIVIICIPIIILAVLTNNGILPSSIYRLLVVIILVIGSIFIGMQIIDMSNRDDMNWDEYNWYFNKSKAPVDTTFTGKASSSDPWTTPTVTCIGSACCYNGSTYDSTKNVCVPNAIYNEDQTKETFRNLEKYAYTQFNTSSLDTQFVPALANLPKF
jgi:hypothetical protein